MCIFFHFEVLKIMGTVSLGILHKPMKPPKKALSFIPDIDLCGRHKKIARGAKASPSFRLFIPFNGMAILCEGSKQIL
jgi:hypothetical protein